MKILAFLKERFGEGSTWAAIAALGLTLPPPLSYISFAAGVIGIILKDKAQ